MNAHVILPGAHRSARHVRRTFDTCFTLSLIYHLYVLFVWISYQARFGLKISYPAIVFTMVIWLLNCGSFIVHILLLRTSKVFTLSVFLPCACVHVLLPGTRRINENTYSMKCMLLQHPTIPVGPLPPLTCLSFPLTSKWWQYEPFWASCCLLILAAHASIVSTEDKSVSQSVLMRPFFAIDLYHPSIKWTSWWC